MNFRRLAIAATFVLGLFLVAPAMPTAIQNSIITFASAGTYEDNVFPRGFPRWGSSPRRHEDRNVGAVHRHHRHHGGQNFGTTSRSGSLIYWRRVTPVQAAQPVRYRHAGIVRHTDGTCSRAGVVCPCAPVSRVKHYQPRPKTVAVKCTTCGPAQQNNAAISGLKATVNGNNNVVIQTANIGQAIGGNPTTSSAAGQPALARTIVCLIGLGLKNGRDADFWHEGTAAAGDIKLGQGVRAKLEQSGKLSAAQSCLRS